ncbi:MAG: DUF805 domain-containing protein [Pseudomonadota bacterium]
MKFFQTISTCFKKYLSVEGIASRREFWFWFLFVVIVLMLATIIDGAFIAPALGYLPFEAEAGRPLATVLLLILAAPTITAAARRLHDSALSGWWLFIGVTIIGLIPLAYLLIKSGTKGENRFSV